MAEDNVEVFFKCKACGATKIEVPDDPTDDSIVACPGCGIEHGRWGDVKAKAMKQVASHFEDIARDAFKRR